VSPPAAVRAAPHGPTTAPGLARRTGSDQIAGMKPANTLLAAALLSSAAAFPAASHAQVGVQLSVHLALPVQPPLIVLEPGVQVVTDFDDEVFLVSGAYWLRRGPYWYRTRRPGAAFIYVPAPRVPVVLARLPPPGHYKHYRKERHEQERAERRAAKAAKAHGRGHGRGHDRH